MVLNIKTDSDINAKDFFSLGNALLKVLELIEKEYQFGEKIDETSLRLYLQSPGKVELKSISKKSLMALGLILVPLMAKDSGNQTAGDSVINNIVNSAPTEIKIIQDSIAQMKIAAFKEIDDIYSK